MKNNNNYENAAGKYLLHYFSRINKTLILLLLFSITIPVSASTILGANELFDITKKYTIKELFTEIESNNGYFFIIDDEVIDVLDKQVLLSAAASKDIDVVLKEALNNTSLEYTISGKQIVICEKISKNEAIEKSTQQQVRNIVKGKITDEFNDPLIGVNIIIAGTGTGTISDIDGNYSVDAPKGAVLHFTYLGYTEQIITVGDNTTINIQMNESSTSLDEIVVVGFGTQKKINLTGSVGIANAEDLKERPVTRAVQALQGLVPGLQIQTGGGSLENRENISIRGKGSVGIGSSDSPLVLIDGMEGDIHSLNPQDIENISVLKDAAASSIYGSRAPFGVVLITTKSGSKGRLTVNYNNSFRFNTPTKRPKMLDSYTFAKYFNEASLNGGGNAHFSDEHLQRIKDYQDGTFEQSIIPNPNNPNYWGDGYRWGNANVDWYNAMYNKWSFAHEHNLSVSGGQDKFIYYLSLNYLDQDGQLKIADDKFKRYTTTAKIQLPFNDYVSLSYNVRFTRQNYSRPSALTGSFYQDLARQGWPTLPLHDPNGYYFSAPSPALNMAEGGKDASENDNIYHQVHLSLEPITNWVTNIEFNYRTHTSNRGWETFATYNHNVAGEPYPSRSNSEIEKQNTKRNFLNFNVYTDYTLDLESGHFFKGLLGFQTEDEKNQYLMASRIGILDNDLNNLDLTTGLDSNGNPVAPKIAGNSWRWRTVGFFGRVNYNYKQRYLIEGNLRYDGTSRFRSDNRWKVLPSFSLGWNVSQEPFWKEIEHIIGSFKLRGSYGILGNQNFNSKYPTYQLIGLGSASGSWLQNGMKPNVAYLPERTVANWKWEKIKTWNVGLDFGMLNNRLTGSFDYFIRKNKDMIGPGQEMPGIMGQSSPNQNNTDMKTYGFDLIISWNDQLKNGFGYGAKFILSDAQSKVTKFPNIEGVHSQENTRFVEGHKIGNIWGYETLGIAKTQEEMDQHLATLPNGGQNALGSNWGAGDIMYKDLDGDGKIDGGAGTIYKPGDKKVIGNTTPRFQFGIELSADWKGVDIRAFFQGVMKQDSFQNNDWFWGANNSIWYSTGFKQHLDYFRSEPDHHLGENLNAYYPRPIFGTGKNTQVQTRYLQNASYIRLKNLQIGYTFPKSILNKISLTNLRVYISGENLWTGTSMAKMFDPETVEVSQGRGYPLSKTVSLGLNVTF